MSISYDVFTNSFLSKITEYDFLELTKEERENVVDNYMYKSINAFKEVCQYDLMSHRNISERQFDIDIPESDIEEIADIVSECMVAQWIKPYVYNQEQLQNVLNTRDFTTYSPAELLMRVNGTYKDVQKNFINMIREYSYRHGDLSILHI